MMLTVWAQASCCCCAYWRASYIYSRRFDQIPCRGALESPCRHLVCLCLLATTTCTITSTSSCLAPSFPRPTVLLVRVQPRLCIHTPAAIESPSACFPTAWKIVFSMIPTFPADPCDRVTRRVGDLCRCLLLSYQSVHQPVPPLCSYPIHLTSFHKLVIQSIVSSKYGYSRTRS